MPKVSIFINKQPFTVTCGEGEEGRVRFLGNLLNDRVVKMGELIGGGVSNSQLLLLTALTLMDELNLDATTSASHKDIAEDFALNESRRLNPSEALHAGFPQQKLPLGEASLDDLLSIVERLTLLSEDMAALQSKTD